MQTHRTDEAGNPAGGDSAGIGFMIRWQDGPVAHENPRDIPSGGPGGRNGAFLIEVLEVCEDRLEFYQQGRFECQENAEALAELRACIRALNSRLERRKLSGTLGTHQGT